MWYNCLSKYLLKEGYINDPTCPSIYMKILENKFSIVVDYVDDINIVRTPNELTKTIDSIKKEFHMKNLGRVTFCLGLEIEYLNKGVFVYQQTYIMKVLKRFYMHKSHSLCTPMVVRSLDVDEDLFKPQENDEELLSP